MKPGERPTVLRATFEFPDEPGALVLRAGGVAVGPDKRNELLARVAAGEHVELEMDIVPFRQREGERNRINIRFREGGMRRLGASGKGTPFMRDHEQGNQLAVGGTVVASKLEPETIGTHTEWRLHQTIKLAAPWAVDQALRGLIHFFSIGWDVTGPVLCSACGKDYYDYGPDGCRHVRGRATEDGSICELVYQDAVLVETSVVPVPAVLGTEVEEIRAAARAARLNGGALPHGDDMNSISIAKLAPILLLAATASESEVLTAVERLAGEKKTLEADLRIAESDLATAQAKVDEFESTVAREAEDGFIRDALATGRIGKGDEEVWREAYQANAPRAKERMSKRKPGAVTPVGQKRQAENTEVERSASADGIGRARDKFTQHGVSFEESATYAAKFGCTDPEAALVKHAAGEEV